MPSYLQNQSVFTLSALANLGSTITGTLEHIEAAIAGTIAIQLRSFQPEIGSWTVVWGPAIYLAPASDRADNVMYVAKGDQIQRPPDSSSSLSLVPTPIRLSIG